MKVVVFQWANPDFFIAHLDVSKAAERPEVLGLWRDFVLRLSSMPVVSIAKIRGHSSRRPEPIDLGLRSRPGGGALECSRAWSVAPARLRSSSAATISMLVSPNANRAKIRDIGYGVPSRLPIKLWPVPPCVRADGRR